MSEPSITLARRRSIPKSGCLGALALSIGILFIGSMTTILLAVAIWPGEVKLVAPLFCSDAQPDAFIVSDTYSVQPGETTTNFTLYCMGPGGDATDHGFFLPFLATMALNIAALLLVIVAFSMFALLRRRLRAPAGERGPPPTGPIGGPPTGQIAGPPEGSTAGPFVD